MKSWCICNGGGQESIVTALELISWLRDIHLSTYMKHAMHMKERLKRSTIVEALSDHDNALAWIILQFSRNCL